MTEMQILTDLATGKITPVEALKLTKALKEKPLTIKPAEKGGISVYGLQRFPVTLYPDGWKRLLGSKETVDGILALADELLLEAEAATELAAAAALAAA
jgi:hypothetical protein